MKFDLPHVCLSVRLIRFWGKQPLQQTSDLYNLQSEVTECAVMVSRTRHECSFILIDLCYILLGNHFNLQTTSRVNARRLHTRETRGTSSCIQDYTTCQDTWKERTITMFVKPLQPSVYTSFILSDRTPSICQYNLTYPTKPNKTNFSDFILWICLYSHCMAGRAGTMTAPIKLVFVTLHQYARDFDLLNK